MVEERNTLRERNEVCVHDIPLGDDCTWCATLEALTALADSIQTPTTNARLFATAAELGVPPVHPADGDLSRILTPDIDRDSPEGQELLRTRAERKAKYDRINGTFAMPGMGAL